MVYVVNMASISKHIFDIYSSKFYQYLVIISLIVTICYTIWEMCTGSFCNKKIFVDIWALVTFLAYITGRSNKYKYTIMWIVLFSQLMLALWITK
jgi:hypothetical protein